MAKNKILDNEPKPTYIRQRETDSSSVQITCRIPASEKKRFDEAAELLRDHGEDMLLVDIVRAALDEAATYVERHYHKGRSPSGASTTAEPTVEASI